MNRRDTVFALVALGLTGAALRARAQAPSKSFRLGILRQTSATDPLTAMLRGALAEVGYVEGQNIAVEWRFADGRADRLPALAVELVKLNPHALATGGDLSIRALRQATTNIPIVAVSDDMVAEGHVASLPRPGGNITGVTILASELNAKRLYLLKEAVPRASRFAALWHPSSGTFHLPSVEAAARSLAVELKVFEVRHLDDLDGVFKDMREWRTDAVNLLASPFIHSLSRPIIDRAARHRLPAIYQWGEAVAAGGMMAYGPVATDLYKSLWRQLDRILKGARPADLPVIQPTEFELVINLKTATTLGLTVPQSVLLRANRVIE
jgi:putative tryptophan/tyrosine transport system substrate-binding protein